MAPGPERSPLLELLGVVHDAPRPLQHGPAQWRQFVALADAVHQRATQLIFQRLDAAAERRLGDVQLFCCTAE